MRIYQWVTAVAFGLLVFGGAPTNIEAHGATTDKKVNQSTGASSSREQESSFAGAPTIQVLSQGSPPNVQTGQDDRAGNFIFWGDGLAQWVMAVSSIPAVLLSFWAIILLRRTLDATRDAVSAAIRDQRPWVELQAENVALSQKDGIIFVNVDVIARNIGRSPAIKAMVDVKIFTFYQGFNEYVDFINFFDSGKRWLKEGMHGSNILPNGEITYRISSHSDPDLKVNELDLGKTFRAVCATYQYGVNNTPAQTGVIFELRHRTRPFDFVPTGRFADPVFADATASIFTGRAT
ncbi:hypothetical protein [Ancylobacter sp. FA202]|uniref:hypothetical protein n=1 Tax=Ancylobacter sp. FA202 TaxID=1111106 RepID=UPI0012DE6D6B|nr:hypothetical protein [Ancylobacter sp. FA202]